MSAILKFDFQKREHLRFSEANYLNYIYGGLPQVLVTTLTEEAVEVTVTVPGINFSGTTNVSRDQSATMNLPGEASINDAETTLTNKTVIVRSTDYVSVHAFYGNRVSSDGSLIHPTRVLQKDYVETGLGCPTYIVSALEDGTLVNVVGKNILLRQFESYQYYRSACSANRNRDFIFADKPVSFTSFSPCDGIRAATDPPPPGVNTCDFLMQHSPPRTQGNHFVLGPLLGRQSGYVFHVIGTETETTHVTFSDGNVADVTRGQYYQGEVPGDGVVTLTADRPVLVVQYTKTYYLDMVGDTFMVVLPPTESHSKNISFPVATLTNHHNGQIIAQQSYISIIIKCGYAENLYLDDQLLNTQNNLQTTDGGFCILRTPVISGGHRVTHPNSEARFLVLSTDLGRKLATDILLASVLN